MSLTADSAKARRVLVVDDHPDGAATVAELLELFGLQVRIAHDGASALRQVREFGPQVVLLDISLPDMNGYEVASRIRGDITLGMQPRLIAMTGWGQPQDPRMSEMAGFEAHWTKPVDPDRLEQLALAI